MVKKVSAKTKEVAEAAALESGLKEMRGKFAKPATAVDALEKEAMAALKKLAKKPKTDVRDNLREEHEYDAIIDRRTEVFSELMRAAMLFATDTQKEKLGQFEDRVQHDLETPATFASLELALVNELQIIEGAIIELKNMVILHV